MRTLTLIASVAVKGSLPGRAPAASIDPGSGPCSGSTWSVVQSLQPCSRSLTRTWIEVPGSKAWSAVTATSVAG